MRKGRCFIIRDRGVEHHFVMQPVKPRGYIFKRNEQTMYCGIVFNEKRANERIEWLSRSIRLKAKLNGSNAFGWLETTAFTPPILAIEVPTMQTFQDSLGQIDTPHVFNPITSDGFVCMSCEHREFHSIHLRKELKPVYGQNMLPMHYQPPIDRQAVEEDHLIIIEHANETVATATEGDSNGNL